MVVLTVRNKALLFTDALYIVINYSVL